jgi:transposase InsO family protein
VSASAQRRAELTVAIRQAYTENRDVYGSIRITRELNHQGIDCGRKLVAKIMREEELRAVSFRKFRVVTTDSKHGLPVADNLLEQDFTAEAPNLVWAADITYVPTDEGTLYVAGIKDLCTRKIVGLSMGARMPAELVIAALRLAVGRENPGPGLIHHSDRGSQYASHAFQEELAAHGLICSMSGKGNCYDNASMESFWGTLKQELVYQRRFRTREEARQAVFEYIEVFYNRQRRHSALGYVSPAEYEAQVKQLQAA